MDCSDLKLEWARVEQMIDDSRKLLDAKMYDKATEVLLDIYKEIKDLNIAWIHDEKEYFEDLKYDYWVVMVYVCSRLAFCYNEIHDFANAYYYGAWVGESGDYTAFVEWINCLVNSNHPEAYEKVCQYYDKDALKELLGDEPEEIEAAYDFLGRRLAYVHVENGYMDAARELLNELKERPSCRKFAEGELDYLDSIENGDDEEREAALADDETRVAPTESLFPLHSMREHRRRRRPRGLR